MPLRLLRKIKTTKHGFTLIELLVIVAILGALVLIAIPTYLSYINKAKVTLAISALESLRSAIESFHVDNNQYPKPPVDFIGTGLDSNGLSVIGTAQVEQLKSDVFSIDSYVLTGEVWTITAKAKDDNHTVLTLSQTQIIK